MIIAFIIIKITGYELPAIEPIAVDNSNQTAELENTNQAVEVNNSNQAITETNTNKTEEATSSATISLKSKATTDEDSLAIDCLQDEICGQQTFTQNLSDTFPIQGQTEIEDYAAGYITVHNDTGGGLPLAINSRLQSASGVVFRTQERKTIPAHGAVEVYCRSDELGAAGNVEAGDFALIALSSLAQQQYYGTTDEAMTGGVLSRGLISQEQVDQAQKQLTDDFLASYQTLTDQIEETNFYELEEDFTTQSAIVSPSIGTEAEKFTLSLELTKDHLVIDQDKLQQYFTDKELTFADYQFNNINIDLDNDSVILTYAPTEFSTTQLTLDQLKDDLAGRTIAQAKQYLETLGYNEIEITGENLGDTLPLTPENISIVENTSLN